MAQLPFESLARVAEQQLRRAVERTVPGARMVKDIASSGMAPKGDYGGRGEGQVAHSD